MAGVGAATAARAPLAAKRRRRPVGRRFWAPLAGCSFVALRWLLRGGATGFLPGPGVGRAPRVPPQEPPAAARRVGDAGLDLASGLPLAGGAAAAASAGLALGAAPSVASAAGVATAALPEAAADPVGILLQAFSLTFVSEIGDKTFFIAAILASGGSSSSSATSTSDSNVKFLTFIGAMLALISMTLLAVGLGQLFHAVPDLAGGVPIDDYASVLAFGYFGVKLLSEAVTMPDDGSILEEEKQDAEEAVKEAGEGPSLVSSLLPPLVLQAAVLVFAAEVGDRSFITATALSAQGGEEAAAEVFIGGITAHALATLLAVLLGELVSKYISEKTLTYIGGTLFLVFAASSAVKLAGEI